MSAKTPRISEYISPVVKVDFLAIYFLIPHCFVVVLAVCRGSLLYALVCANVSVLCVLVEKGRLGKNFRCNA